MADVLFLVMIVAFFGLAVLFVHACDRIIGVDDADMVVGMPSADDEVRAA